MRKIISAAVIAALVCSAQAGKLHAQSGIDAVLASIEANNPDLKIAAQQAEIVKLENSTSMYLEDPEIEFNWLWGQNQQIGNRHDLKISQTIDLATMSGMRSKLSESMSAQAVHAYKAKRMDVLLEARNACIGIVFCNKLMNALASMEENASRLYEVTAREFELGETSVMEVNKARLHMSSINGRVERLKLQKAALLSQLSILNGNEPVSLDALDYGSRELPSDFSIWYDDAAQRNPVLQYARSQVQISQSELSIQKASAMPSLSVGYMSEIGKEDKYRGVTLGVSIPLWRSTNRIRQTSAKANIARMEKDKAEKEYYTLLLSRYNQASGLKAISDSFHDALEKADSREFLLELKARGEISMIQYVEEDIIYYDALSEALEAEKDYQLALSELDAVNL